MLPGYKSFLNRMALKQLDRPVDVPNFHLGITPYETFENIEGGQFSVTMPDLYRDPLTGGILIGQTYEGISGWGSIVPNLSPGDIPYYGEPLGGA